MDIQENQMPYREKASWLSLFAMAVTFGPYFAMVASGNAPNDPLPNLRLMALYALTTGVQLAILGIGTLLLRAKSPGEWRLPLDERDQMISRRSLSAAYGTLLTGMILVGVMMPFTSSGWKITNSALFMIFAAEVVHHGVIVWCYRKQS